MTSSSEQRLSPGTLISLIPLVVGSIAGAGIVPRASAFGRATDGLGALVGWMIASVAISMLAFVFLRLARLKPELDIGVHAHEKDRFGDEPDFTAAQGFRAGSCVCNVSCRLFITSTLDPFSLGFGNDSTVTPRAA
ncbi:hypothetical protein [Paraburkholderia sp. BL10I2N1]|uniref:hypothetical protein n=1 Tax=Paraburkholderia sp. BL10I2N1 TaxID=1938796 RepID=UPI00105EF92C|nr:hypothetical protein [Paraburkholderia sp. BL10I2N1]TDN70197.1 hypothetical protein B0G77_3654 [Paraburkholderia sp. BL10I2N1]